nr:hypothetical protein [Aeromicrobium sp.]
MTDITMRHPSRPGFYNCGLPAAVRSSLAEAGDVLIPRSDTMPPAGDIAALFVSERVSPAEAAELEGILGALTEVSVATLTDLELNRPERFAVLRTWVYQAYYGSPVVTGLMQLQGSAYHGAPQPFGYELHEDAPVPTEPRGTFIPTEEVVRVRR